MAEIFLYAIGIMYTPGPCNLLSLNAGLNGQKSAAVRFSSGISCAMLVMFLLFGYTGAWLVTPHYQFLISCLGCLYVGFLAFRLAGECLSQDNRPQTAKTAGQQSNLSFRTGLVMQLLNPKSFIAILPIVTVQFPAAGVTGGAILLWSLLLSALTFGAPCAYMLMGSRLTRLISGPGYFRALNLSMSLLLLYVAGDIAYSHVYQKWA